MQAMKTRAMDVRDKGLIATGIWILVMWGSLFTRNFPVIIAGFIPLVVFFIFVFWRKDRWKRHQKVAVIVELVLVAPILVLLVMTAVMSMG